MTTADFITESFGYKEIFEYANDAMLIHCAKSGDVLEANRRAYQLFDLPREKLVGRNLSLLSSGNNEYKSEGSFKLLEQAYNSGDMLTFEWEIARPDGSFLPVENNIKRLGDESSGLVLAMMRDISWRKSSEKQLRDTIKYFKRLLSVSSDGIALIDSKGDVQFVSESVKSIIGIAASRIKGKSIFELVHPGDIPAMRKGLRRMNTGAEKVPNKGSITFRLKHAVNGWRIHEANYKNFLGSRDFKYVLINFRDVTDRLTREEEDRQRDQHLNHLARLSLAGEVSAAIAHELNQPLCAAVNYFSGCRNRLMHTDYSRDEITFGLEMAQRELERAGKVVSVIRNFTKDQRQSPQKISVRDVVESSYEIVRVQIQNHLAHCEIEILSDVNVLCDVVLIQQVISNLVANSLDSMDGKEVSSRQLSITARAIRGGYVEFLVSDRGCGVPEYLKEDHFDKTFYTTKDGGLGLGLSLCRKIVQSHRGKLKIGDRSDRHTGTQVSFTLPIINDERTEIAANSVRY